MPAAVARMMHKTAASLTGWVEGLVDWSYIQPLSLKFSPGLNLDVYFLFLTLKTHLVPPMLFSLLNENRLILLGWLSFIFLFLLSLLRQLA